MYNQSLVKMKLRANKDNSNSLPALKYEASPHFYSRNYLYNPSLFDENLSIYSSSAANLGMIDELPSVSSHLYGAFGRRYPRYHYRDLYHRDLMSRKNSA